MVPTTSAEAVDGNGDLLTEILRRLPTKPLIMFKTVSKRWLSLISDRRFSLLHVSSYKPTTSALFLCSSEQKQEITLLPFDNFVLGKNHFNFISQKGTSILHSCNGLFCYSKLEKSTDRPLLEYYACNATTRKSIKVPLLGLVYFSRRHSGKYRVLHKLYKGSFEDCTPENEPTINVLGMYVAFDPQTSPHYRVICVWEWDSFLLNYEIKIDVYRSETGSWGESLGPFRIPYEVSFNPGVFWNNHLHWISNNNMVYFDVDGGELLVISLPYISKEAKPVYFGYSSGHLHVVVNDVISNTFLMTFEIERDYSVWVLKSHTQVEPILALVPEIQLHYKLCTLSFIFLDMGENKDECYIILGINGKLMSYNVEGKTLKMLCDLPPFHRHKRVGWAPFDRNKSFSFHDTILEV